MFKTAIILSCSLGLAIAGSSDPGYDCRPGQKCWPSLAQWRQFNATIDGHLYETIPIAASCYKDSPHYNEADCSTVESYYGESIPRGDHFGQTYWLNWETCHNSGCALLETNPLETTYGTCSLGRLATYYVDVREPSHISAALKFAKTHNIRISVKNTGHDFFGRSMVPNSLAIWTHNLNTLDFHSSFTAHNCPSANGNNVGEMGAGVVAGDAYRFFSKQGMDITGGYEQSVGIAGGFGQGGGVGSFTTTYGLMADNAVEFEVVTAEGEVRIINQCNDPELFWAMRGGGGGTYAVLTKYRVQVHPSLPLHVYTFNAGLKEDTNVTTNAALREILTAHAQNQVAWSDQRITGQIEYFPTSFTVTLVSLNKDDGSILNSTIAPFITFLDNRTDLNISINNFTTYPSYSDYLAVAAAVAKVQEPSGLFSLLASRLIPRKAFTASQIDQLVDAVMHGIETAKVIAPNTGTQIVMETPVSNPDKEQTSSANPVWRDSLWHVIYLTGWFAPMKSDAQQLVTDGFLNMLEPLKELTPGGGAYFNEAHYMEPEWQQTYFGSFYNKLAEIKSKYDPTHIFDCWKCVGWRGENDPFYSCYKK